MARKDRFGDNVYLTTTLPYVNGAPHLGFALELIRADAMVRYFRLLGKDVFFNTGTDEHGVKILRNAEKEGISVEEFVDRNSAKFRDLIGKLNIWDGVHFIRTTDEHHIAGAQEFWRRCDENGYIYKGRYQAKYCSGCELEKTDSELVDGRCPIHPSIDIELIDEENYFFRFSEFQKGLLDLYERVPEFVIPDFRFNEIKRFVADGLKDFPISRVRDKMSWGIPVPGDDGHVMYVWFDALANYVTTLGWPDGADFERYWINGYKIQYAGKDNLRPQSAMWQAMLMACGLPNTDQIIINGFLNGPDGRKMSKSLGNVIGIDEMVGVLGVEGLRYYLLRHSSNFEDFSVSIEMAREAYTAGLVNGLGNLVSRVMTLGEKYVGGFEGEVGIEDLPNEWFENMDAFKIKDAMDVVWRKIADMDLYITKEKPFEVVKTNEEAGREMIRGLMRDLLIVAMMLKPAMPVVAGEIENRVRKGVKGEVLFERL